MINGFSRGVGRSGKGFQCREEPTSQGRAGEVRVVPNMQRAKNVGKGVENKESSRLQLGKEPREVEEVWNCDERGVEVQGVGGKVMPEASESWAIHGGERAGRGARSRTAGEEGKTGISPPFPTSPCKESSRECQTSKPRNNGCQGKEATGIPGDPFSNSRPLIPSGNILLAAK